MNTPTKRAGCKSSYKFTSPTKKKDCDCWNGYKRVPGTKPCAPGSCKKESSPNKVQETLAQEIARLNKSAEVKKSGGKYVIVKGKKMFKAKDGKLHTGQVSDLDTTTDPYAKKSPNKNTGEKNIMEKKSGFGPRAGKGSDDQSFEFAKSQFEMGKYKTDPTKPPTQDDKELDKEEDAKGVGNGNKKKVFKDGKKTKIHGVKGGVGNWQPHQFRK
jgi:hypothetical protein